MANASRVLVAASEYLPATVSRSSDELKVGRTPLANVCGIIPGSASSTAGTVDRNHLSDVARGGYPR
jgi:hypothetical protein